MDDIQTGHQGNSGLQQNTQNLKENKINDQKRQRPGISDVERSLGVLILFLLKNFYV